jgi:bifunctional non-homologous end joining protein LigD
LNIDYWFSYHVDAKDKQFFDLAKKHKIEGIVAKNKYCHYIPGIRTSQWLKIKTAQVKTGVVAGLLLDQEKAEVDSHLELRV